MRSWWFRSNRNPQPAQVPQSHGLPPADNQFHERHPQNHVHPPDVHSPPVPPHAPSQHANYDVQGESPQRHSQLQQRQQQHPYHVPPRGVVPSGHPQGDPTRPRRSPEIGSHPYSPGPPMPPQHFHMRSQQTLQQQFRSSGPPTPHRHHAQQPPMAPRGSPSPHPRDMRQYLPQQEQGQPPFTIAHHHNPQQQQVDQVEHMHHHTSGQRRGSVRSSSTLKENRSQNIQRATIEARPLVKPSVMPAMSNPPCHRLAPPFVDSPSTISKREQHKRRSLEERDPKEVCSQNEENGVKKEKKSSQRHPEPKREVPPEKKQPQSRKFDLFGLREAASILLGMKLEPSPKASHLLLSSPFQQQESIPDVQPIDSATTLDTETEDNISIEYPTRLALPEDGSKLNSMHCFLRSELLELFILENNKSSTIKSISNRSPTAGTDDANNATASPQQPPAKQRSTATPSASGRVGLRCVHCAFTRQARNAAQQLQQQQGQEGTTTPKAFDPQFLQNSEAPMAAFYPKSISELYRLVTSWQRVHLRKCKNLPPSVRETYQNIREADKTRGKTQYWTTSAAKLGLIDCPSKGGGIRFYTRSSSCTTNAPTNSNINSSDINTNNEIGTKT